MDSSDQELLDEFQERRDESAFAEIVRRHGPMVHRVCMRSTKDPSVAEDATQAVFFVLARKVGGLRRFVRLAAWLHGVARRIAMDAERARIRRVAREHVDMERIEGTPVTDRGAERSEIANLIDGALAQLPVVLREAVVLRHLEGLSQEEASARAGCPRGTMAWRTSEGLDRLRRRLEKFGQGIAVPEIERILESQRDVDMPTGLVMRLARLAVADPEREASRHYADHWLREQRAAAISIVGAAAVVLALILFMMLHSGRPIVEELIAPWDSYFDRIVAAADQLPEGEAVSVVVRGLSGRAESSRLSNGDIVVAPASGRVVYADLLDSGLASLVVIEHRRPSESRFCSVLLFPGRLVEGIEPERAIARGESIGVVVSDERMPFAWFGLHEGPYVQMMPGLREFWTHEVRALARERDVAIADEAPVEFEMLEGLAAAARIDDRLIVNVALERQLCTSEPRPKPLADWCLFRSDDDAWLSPRSSIGRALDE